MRRVYKHFELVDQAHQVEVELEPVQRRTVWTSQQDPSDQQDVEPCVDQSFEQLFSKVFKLLLRKLAQVDFVDVGLLEP